MLGLAKLAAAPMLEIKAIPAARAGPVMNAPGIDQKVGAAPRIPSADSVSISTENIGLCAASGIRNHPSPATIAGTAKCQRRSSIRSECRATTICVTAPAAAEAIKMEIGSAFPLDKPLTMEIKGRNLIEGVPKTITIDDSEIREALGECIAVIMNAIRVALERTPPELSADISDRGIVLTGGGALLKSLDKRIREETGLPVSVADDPLASVVLGTGKMLSDFKLLRKIKID